MADDGAPQVAFELAGQSLLARLGAWEIGEVCVFTADRVSWRLALPGLAPGWRRAHSVEIAKEQLSAQVRQWVDAAGLSSAAPPAGVIRAFREGRA